MIFGSERAGFDSSSIDCNDDICILWNCKRWANNEQAARIIIDGRQQKQQQNTIPGYLNRRGDKPRPISVLAVSCVVVSSRAGVNKTKPSSSCDWSNLFEIFSRSFISPKFKPPTISLALPPTVIRGAGYLGPLKRRAMIRAIRGNL